jgi:hypothetical protein
MSSLSYVVAPAEGCWNLRHQGYRAGSFQSRDDALREAIGLAKEANGVGHEAKVVVQDETGQLREAWTPAPANAA